MNTLRRMYILYYDWPNTSGNHAGMAYFSRSLKNKLGNRVSLIKTPRLYRRFPHKFQRLWQYIIMKYLYFFIRENDVVFFMEFLSPPKSTGDHRAIALELRRLGIQNHMAGLLHLPIPALLNVYDLDYITSALDAVDTAVIFGSSLRQDLEKIGYGHKVVQTYHYADIDYYKPSPDMHNSKTFNVVSMGFLYRNKDELRKIIERCPDITFDIFLGNNTELHAHFSGLPNVSRNRVVSEKTLLQKMQKAHASLSVFDDTIGSNVITTSMACGLPQIVSDVGSIRDYCSEENTFFCNTIEEFAEALSQLRDDYNLYRKMSQNARKQAETISLEKSIQWYADYFLDGHTVSSI